jgi:Fe-Mn family superoxide dismutase
MFGVAGLFASSIPVKGITSRILRKGTRRRTDFIQPKLPYDFNALEPYIDRLTMELHYSQHHAAYTKKFNELAKALGIVEKPARDILANVSMYPEEIRNNGGGYLNHVLFWNMMSPDGGGNPSGYLLDVISRDFESFETFKSAFSDAAKTVFGSGWAWLIVKDGKLQVTATQNQDNPLMDVVKDTGFPLLCLDVWEHAYYIKNQNRRTDYISDFWNVVNWDYVAKRYNLWLKKYAANG